MQFEHAGETYYLEFQRKIKHIKLTRHGNTIEFDSKYPYTTARLYRMTPGSIKELLTEHTVGCVPTDNFSNEQGRVSALQGISKLIPKDLRISLWDAYHARLEHAREDRIKSLLLTLTRDKADGSWVPFIEVEALVRSLVK